MSHKGDSNKIIYPSIKLMALVFIVALKYNRIMALQYDKINK